MSTSAEKTPHASESYAGTLAKHLTKKQIEGILTDVRNKTCRK